MNPGELDWLRDAIRRGEELPEKYAAFEDVFGPMLEDPRARRQLARMIDDIADGMRDAKHLRPWNQTNQVHNMAERLADEIGDTVRALERLGFSPEYISTITDVLTQVSFGQLMNSNDEVGKIMLDVLENDSRVHDLFDEIPGHRGRNRDLAQQMLGTIVTMTLASVGLEMARAGDRDIELELTSILLHISDSHLIRESLGDNLLEYIVTGEFCHNLSEAYMTLISGEGSIDVDIAELTTLFALLEENRGGLETMLSQLRLLKVLLAAVLARTGKLSSRSSCSRGRGSRCSL